MKVQSHVGRDRTVVDRFSTKGRLDLNDLIRRKKEEDQSNKKTNLLIVGGTATIAIVVLSVLSL